jgi:hypothetical protein
MITLFAVWTKRKTKRLTHHRHLKTADSTENERKQKYRIKKMITENKEELISKEGD